MRVIGFMDMKKTKSQIRLYGEHITSLDIFKEYILPEVKSKLYDYKWVDLFCGEGNLILPLLELLPESERVEFFSKHIFLFDIQKEMVEKSISNAMKYGIPEKVARKNIIQMDTLKDYPKFLFGDNLPVYHITNPPYLYIGYIRKNKEAQNYLDYFKDENKGFQDLYQIALINDLKNGLDSMIYIIPSNFLFGNSVSNKIRDVLLSHYDVKKAYIFEKKIFKFTGVNVIISFFERKKVPKKERVIFEGVKISNKDAYKKIYILNPENHFKAGNEFDEFIEKNKCKQPLQVSFYLTIEEVEKNRGDNKVVVIDANAFNGKSYEKKVIYVNDFLYKRIKSNILFVRTLDTGDIDGRAGIYSIQDVFGVDGILVSKSKYRTHPIQIFFTPELSIDEQNRLKEYFNKVLEYLREKTDSEFMTTYKYSNSEYTRKYLGLSQVKKIIETFPISFLKKTENSKFGNLTIKDGVEGIVDFLKFCNKRMERSHL